MYIDDFFVVTDKPYNRKKQEKREIQKEQEIEEYFDLVTEIFEKDYNLSQWIKKSMKLSTLIC